MLIPITFKSKARKYILSPLNTHQVNTKHMLQDLFNVCSNHTITTGQESKTHNLKFIIFDTPVTLRQGQAAPNKVIIMKSLKGLTLMASKKNQMLRFFSNAEICQLFPLNLCDHQKQNQTKKEKKGHTHGLFNILQSYEV